MIIALLLISFGVFLWFRSSKRGTTKMPAYVIIAIGVILAILQFTNRKSTNSSEKADEPPPQHVQNPSASTTNTAPSVPSDLFTFPLSVKVADSVPYMFLSPEHFVRVIRAVRDSRRWRQARRHLPVITKRNYPAWHGWTYSHRAALTYDWITSGKQVPDSGGRPMYVNA